ncbi:MarR family winged helix-turn-helix transcriptional regulator [Streptomyces sp. NBC_01281]|uniref:MarR family winged helix-turn-helix transcriptional regulator n=1 Tax=unclassified Streptomyces TaxID=2593676 RepID=UPI002E15DCA0|nr:MULTISPECIES: MarR family winged helix-turn-helix transcriptional regulator [unclassified Streptomyces]WSK65487.1 MarR family winged helix-turn-helix transcriptional regulator [Streptomyces sp. NBC_01281]
MGAGGRNLPQLLGAARRWFDEGLLAALEAEDVDPVTATQLNVFAVLDEQGTTVAELARRMGVTRQTAHQAVHSLIAVGLLEQNPDPESARRRLILRTAKGRTAHERAEAMVGQLERTLAARIGEDAVAALKATLEQPWGAPEGPHS